MVITDISQLNAECNTWISNLRTYREELNNQKTILQQLAFRQTSKSTLQHIEHFQNQFQIQLFNIHDLKLAIKDHERVASSELNDEKAIGERVWSNHEVLHDRYHQLDQTLEELRLDFKQFVQSTH